MLDNNGMASYIRLTKATLVLVLFGPLRVLLLISHSPGEIHDLK
jgi:hypothetical protein